MRFFLKSILFVALLLSSNHFAFSQTEEEMRTQADAYFEKGNYVEATPLYSKILALKPQDHDINFRYGVCLLYNSHSKGDAIRYLNYAVKSPAIDKRAFFYLGRAYHLNYQFNEAIAQYEKFKTMATPTQVKELQVDIQIQACKNGKKLLTDVTDMIVIQKTEIRKDDFYEIYKLNNIGGTILVTDEFQSKIDKSKGHRAIIHFPANSPAIYYSSYGEDGSSGLDIYVKRKLPDGKYSQAQKVPGGVNTPYDEDYAYMHPDGKYLYFCSKGHNSMGGYDVFRCAYNDGTQSFGPAENMDFAISSPDDDILFVVDSLDRVAYFASSRESRDGKIFVYEVRVEKIPMQMAVIKGSFVNSIIPTNKIVTIRIEDFSTGTVVGTYNSKESNGDYLLTFPKAGKYKFFISVKGSEDEHYAVVDIPYRAEFKPLKQKITLAREDNGEQYVKIENLFNEEFDDPIAVMAEIYKEMSILMPNAGEYDLDSLDKLNKNNEVFVEAGLDPFVTNEDVIKVVEDEISDLKKAIAVDEENAAVAYNLAEAKSDSANAMMVQINKDIERAENTTNPEEKKEILQKVDRDLIVVDRLNEESKDLVALGDDIDKSIAVKEERVVDGTKTLTDLKAVPDGDKTGLGTVVGENKTFFEENIKNNPPIENVVETTIKTNSDVATNTQKLNNEVVDIRNGIREIEKDIAVLNQQLDNTKKPKDRELIEDQIADKEKILNEQKVALDNKEKAYDAAVNQDGTANLGVAATIVDSPKNHTADNTKTLTDGEKNAIATKVTNNSLDNNIAVVEKVLDENGIGGPPINLFGSDEVTKNYSLSDWTEAIDKEVQRLQILQMNAVEPDKSKIGQEIERYEDLREEKILQYEKVENDPTKITPDIRADDVVKDYSTRVDDINKITDEGDRRVANLNLNEEVRDELLDEKKQLEAMLDENPGATNIQERVANIDKMVKDLDVVIAEDKKWIENNGVVVVDTDKIVADVDPGYQNSVNTIYKTTDPTSRDEQMRVLNDNFTEKSNERIQELEATVKANPNDAVAKAELAELKRLNGQLLTDNTQPLVKPVVIDVANLNTKVAPDQLVEDYTTRKTDIDKITDPYTKKEAENILNKELSTTIRNEISQLEELKETNPNNPDIQTRIDNLKKLDDQINSAIVANDKWMQANPQNDVVAVDESDVKLANPDYQAEIDKINQIENPDDREKAIEELNKDTEEKIDDRIAELDVTLKNNPNDKAALIEKEELTQIKSQIDNDPNKALTQPTDIMSINTKASVLEIMPDYDQKMNQINASTETVIEKEKDKINLNQNLISLIDEEIENLNNLKTTNPAAAKDIDKRIVSLNTIKETKLAEIKVSEDKIGGGTTTTRPAITISTIMPDYIQRISTIDQNSTDEKTKLTDKNKVNTDLISAIDKKIADLEKEKLANPTQAAAIDKDIQNLETIKTQKQNEINLNKERIDGINAGTISNRPEISVSTIMPDYDPRMDAIGQSTSPEKTKLTDQNKVNTDLVTAIDKKIAELEKEKLANPSQATAIDKDIQNLQTIKTEKQNDIQQNNQRIDDINSGNVTSRPEISIATIMPDYIARINEIQQSSSPEKTKLVNENKVNTELVTAIDKKIAELEKEKLANPSQATAIDKDIQNLQTIKTEKQNDIQQNIQRIDDINSGNVTSRPEISINTIMPDYDPRINAINQNSTEEKTKLADKNKVNADLISAIDKKIADLEKEKLANPTQAAAIDKDILNLQNIKTQKQNEINLNKERIDAINSGTVSNRPEISINTIMPDYNSRITAINQNSTEEKTKLADKNKVNADLISAIDKKIADLEKEKLANPTQAAAIDKDILNLQNIKTQKQNEINLNNERIDAINSGTVSNRPEISINSIMPDYNSRITAINQNSTDEKTKLADKNKVNTDLISAIDKKIADLEKEKLANPTQAAAIDKDILNLQNIKTQKQNEITLNNERIDAINSGTVSNRPEISINSIMPDYNSRITAINQNSTDEKTKLADKNKVNTDLISAIDKKIADLEKEKLANPSQATAIDKDIQNLKNIKLQKQNEIALNNQRIDAINSGTVSNRPEISINTIMPDYDPRMNKIDASTVEEKTKLEQKNIVNTDLISAIDKKIASLKNELKTNPENAAVIQQEIDKLEELKEAKRAEIAKNQDLINSMSTSDTAVKSVGETNPEDFTSDESKDIIESHAGDIEEIKAIDAEITELENQLANTDNPKEEVKIQKELDKKRILQARVENEIIEDLGTPVQAEYNDTRSATETQSDIATATNPNDEAIQKANADMARADILMAEAQQLRDQATKEKDPIVANQLLEQAFAKEQEAKNLIEGANKTYKTARVIDDFSSTEKVIVTNVPEDVQDRQSTEILNQANLLDAKAADLNAQAAALIDSSLTVKKKLRPAMVIEAQRLDSIAAIYRDEAADLRAEGNALKTQEDKIIAALPETTNNPVDAETTKDVIATSEYKNYYTEKTTADSDLFKAEEIGLDIKNLEDKKARRIKEAVVLYGDGPQLEKALANDPELIQIQKSIDSLTQIQEKYRDSAVKNYNDANTVLNNTDPQTKENILAISNRDLAPTEKVEIVTLNPQDADYKAPTELDASIFRTTNGTPVYTTVKPIPVDQQQPSGLVYKVQVGAFRKPLPPEYFNQFAPISGQKIDDGITRYMVGYFTNFTVASNAKGQINGLGYNDAFVVAYCNGQRISVSEAKEIEAGRKQCVGTNMEAVNNMVVNQTTTTTTTTTGTPTNTTTTTSTPTVVATTVEEKQLTEYYTNVPDAAKANQVEIMKGLFWTVQIGVYSKPVKGSLLYNIQPLNSQLTEDGKIRYTTGVYCTSQEAVTRKNEVVGIGIEDAFVTAYYNGVRITLTEANTILSEKGTAVLFNCGGGNVATTTTGNTTTGNTTTGNATTGNTTTGNTTTGNTTTGNTTTGNTTTGNTTTGNTTTGNTTTGNTTTGNTTTGNTTTGNTTTGDYDTTGLYRVRVGYFQKEVPQPFVELLLNHQDEGIVSESDFDENITFYTIPYTSEEEANERRIDLVNKGFSTASVEEMPPNVDAYGNTININTAVETPGEVFFKEGIYYRILVGSYSSEVPGEYATIILQTDNLLETEVDADGNTYIISTKIGDFNTVKERLVEFSELGFENMQIVTYYKYDPIPFEEGNKILNDEPVKELTRYALPIGISADPYIYYKDAVYFRIDIGRFYEEVPSEFANSIFQHSEENILKEETFDGEIIFYTENIKSYEQAVETQKRLIEKGFTGSKLVAFHKYDEISVEKARQILSQ